VDCVPDHPPDAVQLVALVLLHVNVELLPLVMDAGLAVIVTVGEGVVTVTVAETAVLPPGPVHVNVYVVLVLSTPVV
jgi:hypothetical protein